MWTEWQKLPFDSKGELNTDLLKKIPKESGIYAIATCTNGGWFSSATYHIHYVGRTKGSMRNRLANHVRCHKNGSKQVRALIEQKAHLPSSPPEALYVAGFPTKEHKILEQARIKRDDPLLNILGGKTLPPGLTHEDILESELD